MTRTDFKAILNVTADGVITGDYWEGIRKFEQSRAAELQKRREEQRLDDLRRAYSVPGATTVKRKVRKISKRGRTATKKAAALNQK